MSENQNEKRFLKKLFEGVSSIKYIGLYLTA